MPLGPGDTGGTHCPPCWGSVAVHAEAKIPIFGEAEWNCSITKTRAMATDADVRAGLSLPVIGIIIYAR